MAEALKLWRNAQLYTCDGHSRIIARGALLTRGSRIEWVGDEAALPGAAAHEVHDLSGAWVTPGLVDSHTHLVFAGTRATEYAERLRGRSYEEIALAGGGILATVRAVRAASEEQLFDESAPRLASLLGEGVTTVEGEAVAGLDLDRAHDAARRPYAAARIPGSRRRVHRRRRARVAAGARRTGPRRCGGRVLRAHGLQRGAGRAAVRGRAHARPAGEDARRAAQQPRRHADGGRCRRPLLRSPRVRGRSGGRGARARRHRGGAAPDRLLLPGARAPAAARCAARAPRGARGRERLQSGVRARGIAPHRDEHGDA